MSEKQKTGTTELFNSDGRAEKFIEFASRAATDFEVTYSNFNDFELLDLLGEEKTKEVKSLLESGDNFRKAKFVVETVLGQGGAISENLSTGRYELHKPIQQ